MSERRQDILEAVTRLLENNAQGKITTAQIAREIGLSEAALYRHFPSRRRIFIGLFEAIDELMVPRIRAIFSNEDNILEQCQQVVYLWVAFAENNPGLAKMMIVNNLDDEQVTEAGEQLINRIQTIMKKELRDAEIQGAIVLKAGIDVIIDFFIQQAQGLINQFLRSHYKASPSQVWSRQWPLIKPIF